MRSTVRNWGSKQRFWYLLSMLVGVTLVLLVALVTLDLQGLDPVVVKLTVLVPGMALALLISAWRKRPWRPVPLDGVVLLWVLWALTSSALSPFPGRLLEASLGLGLGTAAYWLGRREFSPEDLERPLALVSTVAAASLVLELVIRPPWVANFQGMAAEELVGCMANPNLSAAVVLLGLPAALWHWGWAFGILGLAALIGSLSRGVLFGAVLAGLVALGLRRSRDKTPAKLWSRVLPALMVALLVLGVGSLSGRLRPSQFFELRTVASRIEIWRIFLQAVEARPLRGWGGGRAGVAFRQVVGITGRSSLLPDRVEFAHNPLLQRTVEGGLPALLLMLLGVVCLVPRLRSQLTGARPALALGLLGLAAGEQVGVALENPLVLSLVALVLGSLAASGPPSEDRSRSPMALLIGVLLLAATPLTFRLRRAESLRREIRAQNSEGVARPMEADLPDRYPSPELRYDAAGVLALERDLEWSQARYLVLESLYPDYGSSRENRRSIREYQQDHH